MAALAGTTLVFPGTILDRAWRLNPVAYAQLAPLGVPVGIAFLVAGGSSGGGRDRLVAPSPLGMDTGSGHHCHSGTGRLS